MKTIKLKIFSIILFNILLSSITIKINPQIGNQSIFSIPFNIKYNINNNILINHTNRIYHLDFPHLNYINNNYSRYNSTIVTEISYLKIKYKPFELYFGRNYIESTNKLFFSNYSPSMDHLKINFKNKSINYNYLIIKLNNSILEDQNDVSNNMYINRWYYYRDLSIKINPKLSLTLTESIISTGENRNIEWYYLTPLGLFLAEQVHNTSREDGDSTSINNDNYFIGLNLGYTINPNVDFYTSIIIDDFQIDKEDREQYQDIFGMEFGVNYNKNNTNIKLSYHYASPWLYLNNGVFTNYQINNHPIGLRYPHSHAIELDMEYSINKSIIQTIIYFGERGSQDLNTEWNSLNNKIPYFKFNDKIPIELYFKYSFMNLNKYIPNIIITHNWMGSNTNNIIFEWDFKFNKKTKINN